MERVRGRLGFDAASAKTSVRQMTDWRNVVRRFPWATAGLAAAVGYLVIPKQRVENVVDPDALRKMAKDQRVVVTPPSHEKQPKGMVNTVMALVVAALAREAINYVGDRFSQSMSSKHNGTE